MPTALLFFKGYRYGFNGKENDNEIKGEGNQQDYGFRIYDTRIAKFLSVDPLTPKYPELTPYQFASNRPIEGVDLDGLEFAKLPNPRARALLIVSYLAGQYKKNEKGEMVPLFYFEGMYKAAMSNPNIDVLAVKGSSDLKLYLKDI